MATGTSMGFSLFSTWDSRGIKQARRDLTGMQKVTRGFGDMAKVAFGAAALAVGAYAVAVTKAGIKSNQLTQRVNKALETTLGSANAAKEQLAELREFGRTSPIQLPVWLAAQQKLLAFGLEAQKIVPLLGAIQDAVIAAGGTEEEIKGVVRAFGQMQSKGKLSAEELNQIGERGIDAAGVVADAFNTTSQEIRAGITEGRIGVNEFFDGFIEGSEEAFGGAAEGARQTFAGMVDRLKGAHRRIGEILATPLVNPAGGGAFVEIGNAIADAANNFEDALRPLVEQFTGKLEPSVNSVAEAIREFGESITTQSLRNFFNTIKDGLPILSAFATGFTVFFGKEALELLPGFQRIAQVMHPVTAGLAVLAGLSPELRDSFSGFVDALRPLVPLISRFAITVADVLAAALKVVTPLVATAAEALLVITDNLWVSVPAITAAAAAWLIYSANASVMNAVTLAGGKAILGLSGALDKLRIAMMRHPVFLISTILAGVATAFVLSNEKANEWRESLSAAFSEVQAGSKSVRDAIDDMSDSDFRGMRNEFQGFSDDLDKLRSAQLAYNQAVRQGNEVVEVQNTNAAKSGRLGINATKLRKENADAESQLAAAQEEVNEWLEKNSDQIAEMDLAMASQVESGKNANLVLGNFADALGLSDAEMERIIPELDRFVEANAEATDELRDIAEGASTAMAAIQGLGEELKKQTDPFFALVSAQNDYEQALEKFDEVSGDAEASHRDIENASVDVASALLEMQVAGEEAAGLFGEGLPDDFLALAESMGLPQSAIDTLEQSFTEDAESMMSSAEELTSQGIDHMAQFMTMISSLSEAEADAILNAKNSVDQLIDGGMEYSEAIRFVANNSSLSTQEIEGGFKVARAAGLDFSDDYPAHVRVEGKESVLNDIDQMIEGFLGFSGDVQDAVDGVVDRGYNMEDAYRIVALNLGITTDEVKAMYDGVKTNVDSNVNNILGKKGEWRTASDKTRRAIQSDQESISSTTDEETGKQKNWMDDIMDTFEDFEDIVGGVAGNFSRMLFGMSSDTENVFTMIRSSIEKPINFVVGTLYNDGIVKFWNAVSKAMFSGDNTLNKVGGFAEGGKIRGEGTGTSDSILARLSNGEFVMRKKAVDNIGVDKLQAMNNLQEPPGFFMGGFIDIAGGLLSNAGDIMEAMPDTALGGMFSNFSKLLDLLSGAKDMVGNIPSDSNSAQFAKMLKAGAQKAVDRLAEWWDNITGLFGDGSGLAGYTQMFDWISGIIPGVQLTSGFRPGDPGYHGSGQAVDLAFSDGSERSGGGDAKTAFNAIMHAWRDSIAELIWDFSPIGYGRGIYNGNEHTWNSASAAPPSHNDHIHWAQSGGMGMALGGRRGASRWSETATRALKAAGLFNSFNLQNVLAAISKESSGNPQAINRWDSNAMRGTPSKGLLQTIDPTFNAYAGQFRHLGPYNPLANIYAAVRYASARYGSGWSSRMAAPGGYAAGGLAVNSFDDGGYLPIGASIAYNGTGKPEPVGHDIGGDTYHFHFHNSVVAERQQAEDMIVRGVKDARKHGRLDD